MLMMMTQMQTIGESIVSYEPGWQTSVAELRVLTAFDDDDTFGVLFENDTALQFNEI